LKFETTAGCTFGAARFLFGLLGFWALPGAGFCNFALKYRVKLQKIAFFCNYPPVFREKLQNQKLRPVSILRKKSHFRAVIFILQQVAPTRAF
jgi:hypothetical protein